MTRPVLMRVKVDDALRSRFKGAAWRARASPAQVLRLLMQEYVDIQGHHPLFCAPVTDQTFRCTACAVVRAIPRLSETFVYEDDDEETVARKEGWWCESLAENPKY